jgi:hypothetical protein
MELPRRRRSPASRARHWPRRLHDVLKTATATFRALALCELAERAGVPKGVFSCVTGPSNEIGGELTSNPIIRKLTFTPARPRSANC